MAEELDPYRWPQGLVPAMRRAIDGALAMDLQMKKLAATLSISADEAHAYLRAMVAASQGISGHTIVLSSPRKYGRTLTAQEVALVPAEWVASAQEAMGRYLDVATFHGVQAHYTATGAGEAIQTAPGAPQKAHPRMPGVAEMATSTLTKHPLHPDLTHSAEQKADR